MAEPTAGNDKSELKRLLKVASSHPVHMAMAIGSDGKPIMRMDKTKNAKALEKMIRAESPSAKDVRFGSVSVDPSETTEATFMLNKPLGGAARKLATFLKPAGISKVHIVLEDGTAAESATGEEVPAATVGAAAGGAMGAAAGFESGALATGALDTGALQTGATAAGAVGAGVGFAGGAMVAGAAAVGAAAGAAAAGHHGHRHAHAGAHPAQGQHQGDPAGGKAVAPMANGKDAAAGPNTIPALSDADFSKLMKAIQAELVNLHHPETGPITAVPPAGLAVKAGAAADGAQPEKAKPVVKLSDADFARLQELAKAGHFTLMPADAPAKAPDSPDSKDAAGKAPTGKDAAGKVLAGADASHPAKASGLIGISDADAKHPRTGQPGSVPADLAHPDPAHPAVASGGEAVGRKAQHDPSAAPYVGATPPAGSQAPAGQDGGAMTAARMTKDLTALVKRLMAVVKQNPSQQAELSRLAIDAQGSIRSNDLESAAATMQVLMMSLDAAAGDVPAMADIHAKVNQDWDTVRAHIEADLESHKAEALKAGVDPKRVEEAHVAARATIDPALAGLQTQVDTLKYAKNDADLAAIKKSSQNGLDQLAIHLNNDKLFNLVDVFSPFRPMRALGTVAQFASKFGKGLHLFR